MTAELFIAPEDESKKSWTTEFVSWIRGTGHPTEQTLKGQQKAEIKVDFLPFSVLSSNNSKFHSIGFAFTATFNATCRGKSG